MIIEGLCSFACTLFMGLFEGLRLISLPVEMLAVLPNLFSYGSWVVGADVLGVVFASIFGWWTVKFTVGIVLFIYKLIPLT